VTLKDRSAGAQQDQSGVGLPQPVAAEVQARVGQHVPGRHPLGDQRRRESREQFLQGLLPAGQQRMEVVSLGHPTPLGAPLGQLVSVDHRHLREGVGEDSGGQ
jgi:hypothetical protein